LLLIDSGHPEYLAQGARFKWPSWMHRDWYRAGPAGMSHDNVASLPVYIPAKPLQSADKFSGMNLQGILFAPVVLGDSVVYPDIIL